jgi:GYF domain 2
MAQEIYIRNATESEARGPFNLEQVASLADAGQITPETLVYDAALEQWVAVGAKPELMAVIAPEKRKLTLKPKEIQSLNKADDNARAITVQEILAAAEGRTYDTKGKADPEIAMMRAARIGLWGATLALFVAAVGEILPSAEALLAMDSAKIMARPLVILGGVDLILGVLLALGLTTLYPLIRFRAALGFGLLGFMFYAQGFHLPLLEVAVGAAGLYLCTVFVSLVPAILSALAAVAGLGAVTWFLLTP